MNSTDTKKGNIEIAGKSLTKEQIIAGQKVLVPVVYISSFNNYKLEGGKIIAGKDINLNIDTLNNSGTIQAGENILLNATNSIENYSGTIKADEDISLIAKNDIVNTSGNIKANNINLTSIDGDIENKRYNKKVSYGINGQLDDKTLIGKEGDIIATNNINISTNKNFLNQASNLEAKDIDIKAKKVDIGKGDR